MLIKHFKNKNVKYVQKNIDHVLFFNLVWKKCNQAVKNVKHVLEKIISMYKKMCEKNSSHLVKKMQSKSRQRKALKSERKKQNKRENEEKGKKRKPNENPRNK